MAVSDDCSDDARYGTCGDDSGGAIGGEACEEWSDCSVQTWWSDGDCAAGAGDLASVDEA